MPKKNTLKNNVVIMAQCGHCLVPLPSQVYYAGQLRFGGFSFDCHKVGPEQKNIFFPPLCRPRLQYKGHRLPFPTPWEANITFFRAGFWVHGLGPRIIWVWLGYCYRNLNSPWGFTVVKKMALCAPDSLKSGTKYCGDLHQALPTFCLQERRSSEKVRPKKR